VASWVKSILERRYLGRGFGGGGFGRSGSGAVFGVGAESICVALCSLKQGIEQLESIRVVGRGWMERTYYGIEHVGHLYFFGWARQMPHRSSAMLNR